MPWRATCPMDQRMQFIAACLADEETMSLLCRRFDISRKTGYKWLARFQEGGPPALVERSHAPHRQPHAMTVAVHEALLALRARHPHWGPRKLRAWLELRRGGEWPAASTIGALLQRSGLTVPRRGRRRVQPAAPCTAAGAANEVWCADFKGWFRTADGERIDPLTIYRCAQPVSAALPGGGERPTRPGVQAIFEAAFREYGLPRSDPHG